MPDKSLTIILPFDKITSATGKSLSYGHADGTQTTTQWLDVPVRGWGDFPNKHDSIEAVSNKST